MLIESAALASITAAVALVGNDYMKGLATEAGKATWSGIKALLGWPSDPPPADIPEKVSQALATSPEIAEKLLHLLKKNPGESPAALVGKIEVHGGKVVVADTIINLQM